MDIAGIIRSADDERNKAYEMDGEDDVLRPSNAHKEGHDYDEVGINDTGTIIEETLGRLLGMGWHVIFRGQGVYISRHEVRYHDYTDVDKTMKHDVGWKDDKTQRDEKQDGRNEAEVGKNAVCIGGVEELRDADMCDGKEEEKE